MSNLDKLLDDALLGFDDDDNVEGAAAVAGPSLASSSAAGASAPSAAPSSAAHPLAPAPATAASKLAFDPLGARKKGKSAAAPAATAAAAGSAPAASADAAASTSGRGVASAGAAGLQRGQRPGVALKGNKEAEELSDSLSQLLQEWTEAMGPGSGASGTAMSPSSPRRAPPPIASGQSAVLRALAEQTQRTVAEQARLQPAPPPPAGGAGARRGGGMPAGLGGGGLGGLGGLGDLSGLGALGGLLGGGGGGEGGFDMAAMAAAAAAGGGEAGGGAGGGQMNMILETVMQHLLSKEVLYTPMTDIRAKYPAWLAANGTKVAPEECERYEAQYTAICALCEAYENEPDNYAKIMGLLQQMQECGEPPADIVEDITSEIAADLGASEQQHLGASSSSSAAGTASAASAAAAAAAAGMPAGMPPGMAGMPPELLAGLQGLLGGGLGGLGGEDDELQLPPELQAELDKLPKELAGNCPVQ